MIERPSKEKQKTEYKALIQSYIDSGFRFSPLTEQELRAMTEDELYIQLTHNEHIGSEFETSGGVLRDQMEHRALTRSIYVEKATSILSWQHPNVPTEKVWSLDELGKLLTEEIHKLCVERSFRRDQKRTF